MRKISNEELADLPSEWENSTVDTSKYFDSCLYAWEVNKAQYEYAKAEGIKCQIYKKKYYIGV